MLESIAQLREMERDATIDASNARLDQLASFSAGFGDAVWFWCPGCGANARRAWGIHSGDADQWNYLWGSVTGIVGSLFAPHPTSASATPPTSAPASVAEGAGVGAAEVRAPTGDFYSVAFETKLSPTSYPGVSRGAHFQEANEALLQAMEGDAAFASDMQGLGVNLQRTPTGLAPRTSPAEFTWHHAQEPGVMQLVPRPQHAPGTIFQDALHPNGRGGYSIWGK
jgi:hypothetical protein